jgi:hypothetical protein
MTGQKGASIKWTDEETDFLRKNYRSVAAKSLADSLGKSRNAIIGRANRIGLSLPYADAYQDIRLRKMEKKLPKIVPDHPTSADEYMSRNLLAIPKQRSVHLQRRKSPIIQDAVVDDVVKPLNGVGVSLWDAKSSHCRWIIGDPKAMTFCGHEIQKGTSYCPTHYVISKTSREKVKK